MVESHDAETLTVHVDQHTREFHIDERPGAPPPAPCAARHIALDHLTLAAVAEGLGTCWIGAFNEEKVKQLLVVPANVKVVALTPLGYPASPDLIRPVDESRRKAEAEIFSVDKFPAGR